MSFIINTTKRKSFAELSGILDQYKQLNLELLAVFIPCISRLHTDAQKLFIISKTFWDHCPPEYESAAMLLNLLQKVKEVTALDSKLAEDYLELVLASTPYPTELVAVVFC